MNIYYLDVVLGNDGNAGTSPGAGNAWASFEKAAGTVIAGDWVYVKASASYTAEDASNDCICLIDIPGTNIAPIVWVGYYEFPGDGGIVTMDASVNVLANVIRTDMSGGSVFNVFKNFEMAGATGVGLSGGAGSDDYINLVNCSITNNGTRGIYSGNYLGVTSSRITNNGSYGIAAASHAPIYDCIINNNVTAGVYLVSAGIIQGCIIYGNITRQVRAASVCYINNSVLDGDGIAQGIRFHLSEASVIQNSIIYDCTDGIYEDTDTGANAIAFNNLFYSNTNDVVNFLPVADQPGSFIAKSDPFVDAANRNYRLKPGSKAISRGIDVRQTVEFWDRYDRGINPPSVSVGTSKMDIGAQQRAMVNMRRRFGG